jgi:hypothetical protein
MQSRFLSSTYTSLRTNLYDIRDYFNFPIGSDDFNLTIKNPGLEALLLAAILHQGNHDRNHNLWNIASTEIYILHFQSHVEQEMYTLSEHMCSLSVLVGFVVLDFSVFCVVFCRSYFITNFVLFSKRSFYIIEY